MAGNGIRKFVVRGALQVRSLLRRATAATERPGKCPAVLSIVDVQTKSWTRGRNPHNTRLLSFTFSASRYTLLPISLNFWLIAAIPSSMVPCIDIPTLCGSFSVAA
jgi:hypothetical protein